MEESTSQTETITKIAEEVPTEDADSISTPSEIEMDECETVEYTVEESGTGYIQYYTDSDAENIAKVLLKECGGVQSDTEKACVAWCILNRVDDSGDSIYEVISTPNQFAFYESTEVQEDLLELAYDVLRRWNDEKNGVSDVGRVLPSEYMWFHGDGKHNYFRNAFSGDYTIWGYSLESPYED